LTPLPPAALLALDLWHAPLPAGHDCAVHVQHALALFFILRHQPGEAFGYLRNLHVHWTPLTYFVTVLLLLLRRGVWAFNATMLVFATAFLTFFYLLLRRLGATAGAICLALLTVLANPHWLAVMRAYNLEPALAAAAAFLAWAFVRQARAADVWESIALGAAGAVAMFAKAPTAAFAILPSIALTTAGCRARENRRAVILRRLVFLLFLWTPFLLWSAARWSEYADVFKKDSYRIFSAFAQPWTYYFPQFAFNYAALPLLAALLLAVWRIEWRELPRETWLVFLAGLGAVLFYSAIGAKRPFYPLAAWTLWAAAAATALSRLPGPWRRWLLGGLGGLYALLAVLVWFSAWATPVKILSLGSAAIVPARDPAPLHKEQIAASLTLAAGQPASGVALIDFTRSLVASDLEMLLSLARPEFALVRGLQPPLANSLADLDHKSLLLTVERVDARGPSYAALAQNWRSPPAEGELETAATALERTAGQWIAIARAPLGEYALAVYRNANAPPPMTARDIIARAYLDDLPVFLRETERRCRAGTHEAEKRFALAAATYPDDPKIYDAMRRCLRAGASPAEETALMERILRASPPEPAIFTPILDRLFELETAGAIRGRFAPSATFVIDRLAGDELARRAIVEKLTGFYLFTADDSAAGDLIDAQLAAAPPARARDALLRFAELAFLHGADGLAARLYERALARADVSADEAADLRVRLALLTPTPAEPPPSAIGDAAAAQAAVDALIARNVMYRHQGRPEAGLRILDENAPWLALCGRCRNTLLLEKARTCLDAGRAAQATRLLAAIRGDAELQRMAAELRAAAGRRTRRLPKGDG
jgi:hypothetical protein